MDVLFRSFTYFLALLVRFPTLPGRGINNNAWHRVTTKVVAEDEATEDSDAEDSQ